MATINHEDIAADGRMLLQSDTAAALPAATTRYVFIVEYDGTRFIGFQLQQEDDRGRQSTATESSNPPFKKVRQVTKGGQVKKEKITIQQCLESAMIQYSDTLLQSATKTTRYDLQFRFAGRTDSGVHARGQVVVATLPTSGERNGMDDAQIQQQASCCWWIQKAINSRLPADISIRHVRRVPHPDFDPRQDVTRKRYSYTIKYRRRSCTQSGIVDSGPNTIRGALDPAILWVCPWALEDSKLSEWCQRLAGEHEYSAFVHKDDRRKRSNVMRIDSIMPVVAMDHQVAVNSNPVVMMQFLVEGKGFRRCMVRYLIGFLVDLCRGKLEESVFDTIFDGTDALGRMVNAAPASGLCLEHVWYESGKDE